MASGLLSLKWNNHRSTFFHVLSSIRSKESYCDATLACDGRFYPVHKLVLSTCSEYFEQIFERTQCKHPVIVLKDIKFEDLEALMNYMYVGEVNVLQEKLSGLIKAAECLKIKGLAVPDEDPFASKENRRNQHRAEFESPRAKRRRREDSFPYEERVKNTSSRERPLARDRQSLENHEDNINLTLPKATELSSLVLGNNFSKSDKISDVDTSIQDDDNSETNSKPNNGEEMPKKVASHKRKSEMSMVETNVKAEPPDIEIPDEDDLDSKENLHSDLGYDPSGGDQDSIGGDESGSAHGGNDSEFSENVMESAPQSVEDVVAQALPSSSNFQGNSFSLWEGENSLQNFPGEGFSGENSQGRQMMELDLLKRPKEPQDLSMKTNVEPVNSKFYFNLRRSTLSPTIGNSRSLSPSSVHSNTSQMSSPVEPCTFPGAATNLSHSVQKFLTHAMENEVNERVPSTSEKDNFISDTSSTTPLVRYSFPCHICSKTFPTPTALKVHTRTHTGEKPFVCSYCRYRTAQKGNLATHMRTHTGERPYMCSLCSLRFKSGSALTGHIRSKHI